MFTLDIETNLKLALVEPSFAPLYLAIVEKEREYLGQWLAWPEHADGVAFFERFITSSLEDYAHGKSLVCAIFYEETLVGNIGFNSINRSLKKVEVGYWLISAYQGNGIVTKCVNKLIDIAFNKFDIEKVQISAAADNNRSRAVCERLGFELEGIITRSENLNGRIVDHAIYGLSREEKVQAKIPN